MIILKRGFLLYQPWATYVVKGKLNCLVRSFPTNKLERVGVIATQSIDVEWFKHASLNEIKKLYYRRIGVIGSVDISDCLEMKTQDIKNALIKLKGQKYLNFYPKYLIPRITRTGKAYIWILENAKEWKSPKKIKCKGLTWGKLHLEDE